MPNLWGHWTDLNQTWAHIHLWLLFEKFGPNFPGHLLPTVFLCAWAHMLAMRAMLKVLVAWSVENRQLLGELEGIDLLLQQLSVSVDFFPNVFHHHIIANSLKIYCSYNPWRFVTAIPVVGLSRFRIYQRSRSLLVTRVLSVLLVFVCCYLAFKWRILRSFSTAACFHVVFDFHVGLITSIFLFFAVLHTVTHTHHRVFIWSYSSSCWDLKRELFGQLKQVFCGPYGVLCAHWTVSKWWRELRIPIQVELFTDVVLFRSTLLSRPNKVAVKCPSVHPQTVSLISMKFACR